MKRKHSSTVERIINEGSSIDLNALIAEKIRNKVQCRKCSLGQEMMDETVDEGWKGALVGAVAGGLASGGNPAAIVGGAAVGHKVGEFAGRIKKQAALRGALQNRIEKLSNRAKNPRNPKKDKFLERKRFDYLKRLKATKHPLHRDVVLGVRQDKVHKTSIRSTTRSDEVEKLKKEIQDLKKSSSGRRI